MRIEINQFDSQGVVSTSFVDLPPEQLGAIVKKAQEVTRLHRNGQSLDAALDGLDDVLVSAHVLDPSEAADLKHADVAVTPGVVGAFNNMRASAVDAGYPDDMVMVSKTALEGMGEALRAAVAAGTVPEWKWVQLRGAKDEAVKSQDLQAVLDKMAEAAKLGGAPSIKEAITAYPLLFCEAFAALVEQEQRFREQEQLGMTTIVHIDNEDHQVPLTMVAPAGVGEQQLHDMVINAVVGSKDFGDVAERLKARGFAEVEHVTVEIGPLDNEAEGSGESP